MAAITLAATIQAAPDSRDEFGGDAKTQLHATGRFRVAQSAGRWWLVTPAGHPLYSLGVCSARARGYRVKGTDRWPYKETVIAKYGTADRWAAATKKRLVAWGFNTLGSWCNHKIGLPYAVNAGFSGSHWLRGSMPDYFAPEFRSHAAKRAAALAKRCRDDPRLIGYFLDNELQWDTDWRAGPALVDRYFALPATAPGKRAVVELLKQRYLGDITKFKRVWQTDAAAFAELLDAPRLRPKSSRSPQARADADAITYHIASAYFKTTTHALRAADPGHLILGCRFIPWTTPRAVVRACGEHCDVVSVNFYEVGPAGMAMLRAWPHMATMTRVDDALSDFYRAGRKPLLATEFSFRAMDSGLPNTWPPGWLAQPTVPTQADRARKYEHYVTTWASQPYFVGSHWYNFVDEPRQGRHPDGENGNYGLVNEKDEPYDVFLRVVTRVNADAWRLHAGR